MNAFWKQITLLNFSPASWSKYSYLHRFVGLFSQWRQGSRFVEWTELMGALLISLLIATAPFFSTSQIGFLLLAIAGYWLLLTLVDEGKIGVTPIHILVLLYWGIATVSTAFSPVKTAALEGLIKLTLNLIFFAFTARIMRSPRLTNWIMTTLVLTALVVSVYGIRQQIFGAEQLATWNDPTSELAGDTRVYSYLGNPNLLASYLFPGIAFSAAALFVWQGWLPKILAALLTLANAACLFFTESRGGWIGLMVLGIVFLLLLFYWFKNYLPLFWQTWLLPLILGSLAVVILGAILLVEPLRIRVMSIFAGRGDSSNNFRINVWDAVIRMIQTYPLLGIGPGNDAFKKIYPLFMKPKYTALSAYSVLLEIMVETGIIGFTCFLWLLVTTIGQGIHQIKLLRDKMDSQGFWLIGAIAAMAGILAHGFFDTVWYRPQVSTLWWLVLGLIASRCYSPARGFDRGNSLL
ncbi:IctB family putative bicarbonate transporter [Microcystis aeruginosa]|uniref:Putative bicarbonate transporter, IctB family n=1 Tax=Microcystis aeruginosa Ma_QC_C_20070703_M131 TaxID=2486263 RepID=A0A551X2T5_MICAE|nr:IctB family putative bicarbonate transporter [Microcystis aeruginosa]MDB9392099.1 IctB family putative bicarbonate transporter [Microcystis aeruginosa CS-579]TRT43077.1 MAG: putative bicarbonate transporter, IctB family [Microcystis aeruginosa Ma_QC_C_20070703_M131]